MNQGNESGRDKRAVTYRSSVHVLNEDQKIQRMGLKTVIIFKPGQIDPTRETRLLDDKIIQVRNGRQLAKQLGNP
jgi:hypothetical protein